MMLMPTFSMHNKRNKKWSPRAQTGIIAAVFCVGLLWMYSLHSLFALPDVSHLRTGTVNSTAFIDDYDGPRSAQCQWRALSRISPYLRQAVVIAEDDQFWHHPGFDWEAVKAAARRNWSKRRFAYGASTITQQLARNLFLSRSKNPFRKLKELFIALKLERELSKERILEIYLNVVEWGNGIYGAESAARHYFGTSAVALSKGQAAFLAAILPRPRYYERHRNGPYLERRTASIEQRL